MGIYTNFSNSYYSSTHYTDVKPFVGENFNYHELGIVAASEIAANHNAFMKSIALAELASYEQYGNTDVLYEAVDIRGIFEKIKMFFKKIIEKIHKIFHTFIAKMSSWFGGNSGFAKTYEKEVIKNWANVKNDWEFDYSKVIKLAGKADTAKTLKASCSKSGGLNDKIASFFTTGATDLDAFVKNTSAPSSASDVHKGKDGKWYKEDSSGSKWIKADGTVLSSSEAGAKQVKEIEGNDTAHYANNNNEELTKLRENMPDIKDGIRDSIITSLKDTNPTICTDFFIDKTSGMDQSEFTEELFKVFRNDEDSKVDLDKRAIETCYGSITAMMTFIKDFDKTKSSLEKCEKNLVKAVDDLIKRVDKAEDTALKDKANKDSNEGKVQVASLFQTFWGAVSESYTQMFGAILAAHKDACVQAKEIAVKVIGLNKKMTESYDYSSSSYNSNNSFDFISSVKLV